MTENNRWRGYIFSREIDGRVIPQRIQNLVIREYARKNELNLQLSAAEYNMENCYMILHAQLKELDNISGLVFYSVFMLPKNGFHRKKIYDSNRSGHYQLRFALEELSIENASNISVVEDLLMVKQLSIKCSMMSSVTKYI